MSTELVTPEHLRAAAARLYRDLEQGEGPYLLTKAADELARLTRELEEARACCKWEEGNQRRALEYWDGEYGTTLAEEFPFGCDTIEHVAEALIHARRELEEARERERAIVEACAAVCESRATSHFQHQESPGWLDKMLEARKCATAIRAGYSQRLAVTPPKEASDG